MLNVTAQQSPEAAKAYFAKAYYAVEGAHEINGNWGGKGAKLLGLEGRVDKARFDMLCDNVNPQTGRQLTAITRTGRRVGYDMTWSASKSISVVHAITGDEQIVAAFRDSVRETMDDIERDVQTRVRKGGQSADRNTATVAWAEFVHLSGRPVDGVEDPQLHIHAFCFNATFDAAERQWKAGQFGLVKANGNFYQAAQQARFAAKLKEIGYDIRPTKHAFEIVGVPQSVLDKFSRRTGVIEALARKLAEQQGVAAISAKAKSKLAATSRNAKDGSTPYPELVEHWRSRLTIDERRAIAATRGEPKSVGAEDRAHVRFAADDLFERSSVIDSRRLMTAALRRGIGEVTPDGVERAVRELKLISRQIDGRTWVTRRDILAEERRMISFAAEGKGTCRPIVTDRARLAAELAGTALSTEQGAAVSHILTSTDRVMILRGKAGTGKTTLTREAVDRIERTGRQVVMLAPSAQASRGVLREVEGFDSADTLTRFLTDTKMQETARNGVVWLDEAGMAGSRTLVSLFDAAAAVNARIVLAGDKAQIGSIERGAALRLLETKAGLKVAEVAQIRRQSGRYRSAVAALSAGKVSDGLKQLDDLGWVRTMPAEDKHKPIARQYVARLKETKDIKDGVLIIAPTHAEAAAIRTEVRQLLRAEKLIGESERQFEQLVPLGWSEAKRADSRSYGGDEVLQFHRNCGPFKAGQRVLARDVLSQLNDRTARASAVYGQGMVSLSKGDLIRITANGKTADGHRLNNGACHIVDAFLPNGNIRLTNGWAVDRNFAHINHGYVSTAHASQGRTVEHVIVAASERSLAAVNREATYVALSRGRKSATVWLENRDAFLDAAERSDPRPSATELVMERKPTLWQRTQDRLNRLRLAAAVAGHTRAQQLMFSGRERSLAYER